MSPSIYARGYSATGAEVAAAADDMQPQWYDRHWDASDPDGGNAVDEIESRMNWVLLDARELGVDVIPHHVFFSRLKVADPTTPLLKDSVHATDDVQYGLAAMSFHSATGESTASDGISDEHAYLAETAETVVRQWATLEE
ncbi:MAG: hypothetical protein GY913_07785 [Proteobacteria bacterium]|nr:hypothetical protein [Pseudomonadota bacterium]MCP4916812.1 hypothetical protein [Pseudomonadota bacterium]